jgi:hypothetical protein
MPRTVPAYRHLSECPTCGTETLFRVLWISGEPELSGPPTCEGCGTPLSHGRILVEALEALASERNGGGL